MFGSQREVVGLRGTVQDITARRALLDDLAGQHELLRVTLQSIGDAVITTDAHGLVTWLNPVAERLTGWQAGEAKGRKLREVFRVIDETTRAPVRNPVDAAIRGDREVDNADPALLISHSGEEFSITESAVPIRNESGELLGAVLIFCDVTEQRRLSSEMNHRAQHDGLTGLLNRTEFELRVQHTLAKLSANGTTPALLYIDLDQFKIVNDTCGHAAGDLLLQNFAGLLCEAVPPGGTIARLGGDEFAVLLEDRASARAESVAQRICDRLDDYRFLHDGMRFRIGASIGLVAVDSRWLTSAAILQAADTACYAAKDKGRNRVHTWFEADHAMLVCQGETRWSTRLEDALDEGRFRLFAQKIWPIGGTGGGRYLEVLLRLIDGDGTISLPGAFLPAAERFHLSSRIDRLVLGQVIDLIKVQPDLAAIDTICVNISGQSICDSAFRTAALTKLMDAGLPICRRICLEITETAAVTMADAVHFIDQVRGLGVPIALDDFGAGVASFGYLKSLAIDVLKIDGQFIRNMVREPLDEAAVRCLVDIARIKGLKIVAEGVEDDEAFSMLKDIGADFAQGYLFHRPEPIENVFRLH